MKMNEARIIDLPIKRQEKYFDWIDRAKKRMPHLGQRINKLGQVFYTGCGFHYSMVNQWQGVANSLDDFDLNTLYMDAILLEVRVKSLERDVKEAELDVEKRKRKKL